jgi:hypothetical protein
MPVSALNQLFTFYLSVVPVYFLKKDSDDATKQPVDLCIRERNVFYFSLIQSGRLVSLLKDGDTVCAGKVVYQNNLTAGEMIKTSTTLDFEAKITGRCVLGSHTLFASDITEEFSNDNEQLGYTPWFNKLP